MGEPERDKDILIQSLTREVQNNHRQMDALVRRYGHNELSDDESGSPFTNGVLRMPFPERFRMPHVEQFKKYTDPKEHTLGDLGFWWFGRLPTASISSFSELSKAFSRQFLGNVHRKKSVAHLSQLKQGKDESLKKYLGRFSQEVSEIGSANDEAIIAAFINNLQNGQLSFDLKRARLTSYVDIMDMDGGYALAEEEEIATGGYFVHGGRPEGAKTKDQAKAPDTKDREKDSRQGGQERKLSPKRAGDEGAINTIFGGPATGKVTERDLDVNSIEPDPKRIKEGWDPIIFTEADSHGVDVKPNDALVINARIGHREVHWILIDNGSSADVLSAEVYDQLRLDRKDLQPIHTPLRGFGEAKVRSLDTVKLPVTIGKAPVRRQCYSILWL
ncbi:hypothetical protein LWI29_021230 [Acer saccharum]|uniref:Retrotransposon gag domain-containing protein n=1 Tax=Acer saccharum TaxID=4024 RepID=A0AA39RQX0_ACESA|nr:hypothetical protein LWI29_021230 [Acer saccharum]